MIPTAEEFFEQEGTYPELAITFAKLHVEAALKAAVKNAEMKMVRYTDEWEISERSILNAYPLENIK